MNCSWCHKPIPDSGLKIETWNGRLHAECYLLQLEVGVAKQALDIYEAQERLRDPDCDPMASAEAQRLLAEYRRLNRLALNKLDKGNRARLMFGQPLID